MTVAALTPKVVITSACFRERVVRELADLQEQTGRMPTSLVDEHASVMGIHSDHLRRVVRKFRRELIAPKANRKSKKVLPDVEAAKVAYFKHGGDANAAFEELKKAHLHGGMVLRTFQRRVDEWDSCLRACAKGGHREMVKRQFFNREHQPYRTYVYATDHTKLPIRVIPEKGTKPVFPWLSVLMDLKTRAILCWVITAHDPDTDDNLALLTEGIRGREVEGRGFLGGLPEFLRTDRGGDYISKALALGLVRLDIVHKFTEAYSSNQNGRVERVHRRIDDEFAPTQVGYQDGGEDVYTKRIRKTVVADQALGTIQTLRDAFGEWVEGYNNTPHRGLKGVTPFDAWFSDPHPVKTADDTVIAHALMRSKRLKLQKYGIDFRKNVYSSTKLAWLFDREVTDVEVRYYAHDDDVVEVFHEGEWVCTATRTEKQSDNEKAGIVSHRRSQVSEADRLAEIANYQKALDREEDLRRRGIPKDQWPARPPKPGTEKAKRKPKNKSKGRSKGGAAGANDTTFYAPTAAELTAHMNNAS